MSGFTDVHAHFVYGVDDGARTKAEMEAMLDAANADGITSLFATPHVMPGVHPFDRQLFHAHFREAEAYCRERGYSMKLYTGAEILYTPVLEQYAIDHELPVFEDSNKVLLEFTPEITCREMDYALSCLARLGYIPVLAHIERYSCLFTGSNAIKLKQYHNVHYQVNANTLLTGRGYFRMRKIQSWLRAGLVDYVASDAHDTQSRPFQLRKAYRLLKERYGLPAAEHLSGPK